MNIALVAHDNCKKDLVRWAREHVNELKGHRLTCTGTTGRLIDAALRELLGDESPSTPVECLKSGPLGGDQQMGSRIAEGRIDALIFFWDPMLAQPHDVDVKALLRISNLYNIPTACNVATANCLVSSPAFLQEHPQSTYDFPSIPNVRSASADLSPERAGRRASRKASQRVFPVRRLLFCE